MDQGAVDGLRVGERTAERKPASRAAWERLAPGSDPGQALELAEPLVRVQYAARYQEFPDGIEPSGRRYHEGDPAGGIRDALEWFAGRQAV